MCYILQVFTTYIKGKKERTLNDDVKPIINFSQYVFFCTCTKQVSVFIEGKNLLTSYTVSTHLDFQSERKKGIY